MMKVVTASVVLALLSLPPPAHGQNCTSTAIGNQTYTNCIPAGGALRGVDPTIPLQAGRSPPCFGPYCGGGSPSVPYQPIAPTPSTNCISQRIGNAVYTNCQ
jgi:hypothetical protein